MALIFLFTFLFFIFSSLLEFFQKKSAQIDSCRVVMIGSLIFTTIASEVLLKKGEIISSYGPVFLIQPLAFIILFIILSQSKYTKIQKIIASTLLFFYLTPLHFLLLGLTGSEDLFLLYLFKAITVIIFFMAAFFFSTVKSKELFQLFLFLSGLRFIVIYFEALGGLALTGVGLLSAGVLIVAPALLWNKYRLKLQKWIETTSGAH